eukprot:5654392-Alexandrium_andersonii.AAC.1
MTVFTSCCPTLSALTMPSQPEVAQTLCSGNREDLRTQKVGTQNALQNAVFSQLRTLSSGTGTFQHAVFWEVEFPESWPTKKRTSCFGGAFRADGARERGENAG